jgi:hypothetical protein
MDARCLGYNRTRLAYRPLSLFCSYPRVPIDREVDLALFFRSHFRRAVNDVSDTRIR